MKINISVISGFRWFGPVLSCSVQKKLFVVFFICMMFFIAYAASAQDKSPSYVCNQFKGMIFLFPKMGNFTIRNMKDTADHIFYYKQTRYNLRVYKMEIYLDGKFLGEGHKGDTIKWVENTFKIIPGKEKSSSDQ